MNVSIVYAVVAMVCYGLSDFVYKRAAAEGIGANHFLMVQAWFFCPLVILYALVTRLLVPDWAALWGSLAGAFVFIGFYFFFRSLASGSVSTNASIFRLNFVVTAVLAIAWLGETVTLAKIVGLALALAATWLLLGLPGSTRDDSTRQSLIHVGIATLAFGASNFFHTVGLRHGAVPETLAVAQAALFMPLATAVVYIGERSLRPPPTAFKYGAIAAVVLLGATVCLLRSVARGQASALVPITQMGFVVAALLGIVVLREPVSLRKGVGLAAAVAALVVLAGS
jgi:transporter family protein